MKDYPLALPPPVNFGLRTERLILQEYKSFTFPISQVGVQNFEPLPF
jgi:hypothetical protein